MKEPEDSGKYEGRKGGWGDFGWLAAFAGFGALNLGRFESRGLFREFAKQTCEFHIEARCSFEIFSHKKQKNISLVIAYWSWPTGDGRKGKGQGQNDAWSMDAEDSQLI